MTALHISFGHHGHAFRCPGSLPIDVLLSAIPGLPRRALDRLVERAIDQMDEDDGDPDVEANGDELDGDNAEDEIAASVFRGSGPGCLISDPAWLDDESGL